MTFVKGKSGNPNGRRVEKLSDEICKKYGPKAIEVLAEILHDTNADIRYRLDAAKYLADRAYGKAAQAVELSGKDGAPIVPIINISVGSLSGSDEPKE